MKKFALAAFLFIVVISFGNSQTENNTDLPQVFEINQFKDSYDEFLSLSDHMLLSVCNNYIAETYQLWNNMMGDLEKFALSQEFDLAGAKMFIRVIWNQDGTVKHFAYEKRANSKFFEKEKFNKIISEFLIDYKFPKTYTSSFFHYGSVNFPVKKK